MLATRPTEARDLMHSTDSAAGIGTPMPPADLSRLAGDISGPVLQPGDDGYAREVQTFNLSMQQQPAVAVGATATEDISAAVRFAGQHQLPVAVLATGHGA